jgi:hypothetical protein
MHHHLDTTLILTASPAPQALYDAAVSLATPNDRFAADKATLNLFLCEVKQNACLRDVQPTLSWIDAGYERLPLRADCADMVTASSISVRALWCEPASWSPFAGPTTRFTCISRACRC